MNQPLSRGFTAIIVAVLLLCSVVVAGFLCYQVSVTEQIGEAEVKLEAVQGRLRKQEAEFAQYRTELPLVEAQLAELQPVADAAYEQEQALRQQRKELRAEKSALEEQLAALQAQASEAGEEALQLSAAIERLQEALVALGEIGGLLK
ncbi:MAG: hypothetical protein ACI4ME_12670 [Aristaeellaceae bacterium]